MAVLFPGWDTVDAAARWHRGFEIAGFVALGLLLLFEILAYIYGNRKDALITIEEGRRAGEAQKQQGSRDQQIGTLQSNLDDARQRAQHAEKAAEEAKLPRRLSEGQKRRLISVLSLYPGQAVATYSRQGDTEAAGYRGDFEYVFERAGWTVSRGWFPPYATELPPMGITIRVVDASRIPPSAKALMKSLKEMGIESSVLEHFDKGQPENWFGLQVGQK